MNTKNPKTLITNGPKIRGAYTDNGIIANTSSNVRLGGTLLNQSSSIDFGTGNTSSNLLFKKGASNYFFIGNDGNIGIGNNIPAQKLDVTGMIQSSTGFKYGSTIGANLEVYGTYSRLISNSTTDGLMFWTSKNPSSMKFLINNGGRGLMLDGSTSNLLFMDGSGYSLSGIGSANGTGHLTFLYSTAAGSHTEGARLTNTGNLGIGVTNPWAKLDIRTPGTNGADQNALNIQNPSTAAYATVSMTLGSGNNSFSSVSAQRNNTGSGSTLILQTTDNTGTIQPRIFFNDAGNVGIGTQNYAARLSIYSPNNGDGVWIAGPSNKNVALLSSTIAGSWNSLTKAGDNILLWKGTTVDNTDAGGLVIGTWSNSASGIRIASNGNVGIGTANTNDANYKLFVETGIRTRKVRVDQTTWSDYVFEKEYVLPTLNEVESFIHKNKHLPGVPSAKEVEKNGLDVAETQAILLKKIEELTLYVIELQKEIDELKNKK